MTLSSGGLSRYVKELSVALALEFPEDTYQLLSDQPFTVPECAPPNLIGASGEKTSRRWWLRGLGQALAKSGAQLFHGTNFEVPYLGQTPSILTVHDLSPWRNPEWHANAARVRRRTPWLIRLSRARIILTVSEAVRREVIAFFRVAPAKVRAIPLAASPLFRPSTVIRQSAARPFFLFVGTLEPRKNIAALVEAWRETRDQTGADLTLAGRTRPDFVPVRASEGLNFLGEVPDADLPGLYSDALGFVYPTLYEGFGLPVLEAMQCGCPVITSLDPAVTEISGGAALHAGNARDLAEAMRRVASEPNLRHDLRQAGLARAQTFSWSATARQTRALYAEVLGVAA